jgi:hypothetical protein
MIHAWSCELPSGYMHSVTGCTAILWASCFGCCLSSHILISYFRYNAYPYLI